VAQEAARALRQRVVVAAVPHRVVRVDAPAHPATRNQRLVVAVVAVVLPDREEAHSRKP
jgi:hypothetical protein